MSKRNNKSLAVVSLSLVFGFAFLGVMPQNATIANAATAEADKTLVATYKSENGAVSAPTVVVDATDKATLDEVISTAEKPSNVILRVDEDCNVISAGGEVIDSFSDVYTALDKKVIPVLYVASEAQADGVISYFSEVKSILDIAVMSNDAELVGKIKNTHYTVRGIVEFDGTQTKEDMVKTSQLNQAMTVVVPDAFATVENVSYLQGMFKTVWVRTAGTEATQLANAVFSGAYGVIAQNAKMVYAFYKTLPENTYVRTPFIVAHRADVQHCNENSLSGIASSAEGGATHVELDFHVTKDKKLVAMHDDTLTRTTNGSGSVASMTLAQIQQYQIDDHATAAPESIPTLEDCVRAILETDMIFVLELKCKGTEIVSLVKETLTSDPELSPILDRMVAITFYTDQLAEMKKVFPEVPTANLNTASQATLASVLTWMGQYNTGIDTSNGNLTAAFQRDLRDRGIIDWTYTHSTFSDVEKAQKQGLIGLTTNQPTTYAEKVKGVFGLSNNAASDVSVGASINVMVTTYNGFAEVKEGKIAYLSESFLSYEAVASVEIDGYTYFTQSFTINKMSFLSGCKASLAVGSLGSIALIGMAMGTLFFKKRQSKDNR